MRPKFKNGEIHNARELRAAFPDVSRSQAFKLIKTLEQEKTANVEFEFEPVSAEAVQVPPLKEGETPTVTPKAKTKAEAGVKVEAEIAKALAKGALTKEQLTAVFSMVNELLLNKYHTKESCELMGSVWYAPINRLMAKYSQENVDIYIAIIISVMWFATPLKDRISGLFHRKGKEVAKPEPEKKTQKV